MSGPGLERHPRHKNLCTPFSAAPTRRSTYRRQAKRSIFLMVCQICPEIAPSKSVKLRSVVDQNAVAGCLVRHPIGELVEQYSVIGHRNANDRMRPVGAPANAIGPCVGV